MRNPSVIGRAAALAAVALAVVAVAADRAAGRLELQGQRDLRERQPDRDRRPRAGVRQQRRDRLEHLADAQRPGEADAVDQQLDVRRRCARARSRRSARCRCRGSPTATSTCGSARRPARRSRIAARSRPHDTASEVDLDEVLDTLDAPTRKALQEVIQGSAAAVRQRGPEDAGRVAVPEPGDRVAQRPVPRDQPGHEQVHAVHRQVLEPRLRHRHAALGPRGPGSEHLSTTTRRWPASTPRSASRSSSFPGFMALADTTFVNLRNALGVVQPLVDVSKPVAPEAAAAARPAEAARRGLRPDRQRPGSRRSVVRAPTTT